MGLIVCSLCKGEKDETEFNKDSSRKNGRQRYCTVCRNKKRREISAKKKKDQDGWIVYYLPEEHYVGITSNLYRRMSNHKNEGRSVIDVEIVSKHKTPEMAALMEAYLHTIGYRGSKWNQ